LGKVEIATLRSQQRIATALGTSHPYLFSVVGNAFCDPIWHRFTFQIIIKILLHFHRIVQLIRIYPQMMGLAACWLKTIYEKYLYVLLKRKFAKIKYFS